MTKIGDFKFKRKFAFFPRKIYQFDLREGKRYEQRWVWMQPYYEVWRFIYITWSVPPSIGWSYENFATKKVKRKIEQIGKYIPMYGRCEKLLTTDDEIASENEKHQIAFELKMKEYSNDFWLQGLVAGMRTR